MRPDPTPVSRALVSIGRVPARVVVLGLRAYQQIISPALPVVFGSNAGCRFAPTCSHYAIEAVQLHGAISGIRLALARLARCHPFHSGGIDPVPAVPRCVRVE